MSADRKKKKKKDVFIYYFPRKHSAGLFLSEVTLSGAVEHQAEPVLQGYWHYMN